jgi:hypothetical protein
VIPPALTCSSSGYSAAASTPNAALSRASAAQIRSVNVWPAPSSETTIGCSSSPIGRVELGSRIAAFGQRGVQRLALASVELTAELLRRATLARAARQREGPVGAHVEVGDAGHLVAALEVNVRPRAVATRGLGDELGELARGAGWRRGGRWRGDIVRSHGVGLSLLAAASGRGTDRGDAREDRVAGEPGHGHIASIFSL